jgi:hypothetical protein
VVAFVLGELVGKQADGDFRVVARVERPSLGLELLHEFRRVRDVAVVRKGDAAGGRHDDLRLRGLLVRAGGRGVPRVPDAGVAPEFLHDARIEDLPDEAHRLVRAHLELAVQRRDAGGFLAAVLERLESVIQERRNVLTSSDPHDAAVVVRLAIVEVVGKGPQWFLGQREDG